MLAPKARPLCPSILRFLPFFPCYSDVRQIRHREVCVLVVSRLREEFQKAASDESETLSISAKATKNELYRHKTAPC